MTFTRDELETMFQVYSNEIARLTKRANDATLDRIDLDLIKRRIEMLQGILAKVSDELAA